MIVVKIHNYEKGKIVALCDENILGKKFSENGLVLDLSSNFYKGEIMEDNKILELLKDVYITNASGDESVRLLLKNKFVEKENIIKIKGIPHSECILIK